MRGLFTKDVLSEIIEYLNPRGSGSTPPDLTLVLYNNPGKFVAKFIKVIRVNSVHVKYRKSTANSNGNNSNINLELQGSQ